MNPRLWLRGLLAAIIASTANSVTVIAIDPLTFNFDTGLKKLLTLAGISAVWGAALYLKEHPDPWWDGQERRGRALITTGTTPLGSVSDTTRNTL